MGKYFDMMIRGCSNYDFAVLHANLETCGLSCFPMTAADLEGTEDRSSVVARGRFEEPFAEHCIAEGSFHTVSYILRIPAHGGHWIALCPPESVRLNEERPACSAVLCDSIHPMPYALSAAEVSSLLVACAFEAIVPQHHLPNALNVEWACFLIGMP